MAREGGALSPQDGPLLGIAGAGQLALYLGAAALKAGCDLKLFCKFLDDPATRLMAGKIVDTGTAESRDLFLSGLDLLIFENEFVDTAWFEQSRHRPECFPNLSVLHQLSRKDEQKKLLDRLKIAQPAWFLCDTKDRLLKFLERIPVDFPRGAVIKWAKFGYDGYGNFVIDKDLRREGLEEFCLKALERNVPIYAEEKILLTRELAITGCRDRQGHIEFFPLVQSIQKGGACYQVLSIGADPLEKEAREVARAIAEETQLRGTFAVEFFDRQGTLLVNEIAPRVHNTTHYSLSAADLSQFDLHLRAALDVPLSPLKVAPHFAMLNLLGRFSGQISQEMEFPEWPGTEFFWYGKKDIKPGRKLGHVNVWGTSPQDFNDRWNRVLAWEDAFWQDLQKKAETSSV